MSEQNGTLAVNERRELVVLERVIETGIHTFHQVGRALAEIKAGKLYRETHARFEDYCRERWGFKRAHAFRLIDAAEVMDDLSPIGDILPANEAQARELVPLPARTRREVWEEANEGKEEVTAASLGKLVRERLAAMTPEQQLDYVQTEEEKVLRRARPTEMERQAKRDADREKLVVKMFKLAERAGEDAEPILCEIAVEIFHKLSPLRQKAFLVEIGAE